MYNRKQNVIHSAHQLFIEKGFQATSIQDILDYSGISKGTFYNYFSSKNELLIAIYKTIHKKLEKEKNDLLVGQDPSDIEIFIKQIELQMITNRKNKLIALFEEVMASNDNDLKQFILRSRLNSLHWYYKRFIEIFGEDKRPYLLDCAIMFQGILQINVQYNRMAYETGEKVSQVVRYSVSRLVKMVEDVVDSNDQLLQPELIEKWLPGCQKNDKGFKTQLLQYSVTLRKTIAKHISIEAEQTKFIELLDFIIDELLHSGVPRKFITESALYTLKENNYLAKELPPLEKLVKDFFSQLED
ncbi:AcrR family transcriptional regulator [Bacillus sp. SLBN-46]|uniref:TetR/AcrR family transcriptional regulator n=1 Tax=Bacillus sp. SLBN-46 TaxID=3042283 RepID=UPI002857AE36|nr:TetR/AcrR family transcriptional regulator [Bacillus sp. SLBN-46]MDR6123184.1 AcrR family transcriptional regulator [Bacillus sp. SLBN-46]